MDFPDYVDFGDDNNAYSSFFWQNRSLKTEWVKGNTQKGFDREVLEKSNFRNKSVKRFK